MIASSEQEKFTTIPKLDGLLSDEKLDYVHITTNNTIEGTEYVDIPHVEKCRSLRICPQIFYQSDMMFRSLVLYMRGAKEFRTCGLNDCYYKKRFNWGSRSLLSDNVKL